MTNLTFDGVELITSPITLGTLECGHDFTATGHVDKGDEVECPEGCLNWAGAAARETVPVAFALHTFVAENIEIS